MERSSLKYKITFGNNFNNFVCTWTVYMKGIENLDLMNLDFLFLRNEKWVRDTSWKYQWNLSRDGIFVSLSQPCFDYREDPSNFGPVQVWHIGIGIIFGKSRLLGTRLLFYFMIVKKCLKPDLCFVPRVRYFIGLPFLFSLDFLKWIFWFTSSSIRTRFDAFWVKRSNPIAWFYFPLNFCLLIERRIWQVTF